MRNCIIKVSLILSYAILFVVIGVLSYKLHKATICNKAFVAYLYFNQDIRVNLDYIYKDAKQWVNLLEYQIPSKQE